MPVSLRAFAAEALQMKRIRYADLRRLERDVLPFRITSRDDAEILLSLDGSVVRSDRAWAGYLVPAVASFVIWGLEPAGRIDDAKAVWLLAAVATARRKIASAIIRKIVREAPQIDDAVRMSARPSGRVSRRGAQTTTELLPQPGQRCLPA